VNAVEPLGGWRAPDVATTADVAVTMLKALDLESELPPAAPPIDVYGTDFQLAGGPMATPAAASGSEGFALRAGRGGLQAVVFVHLPEPGLYTVSVFGTEGRGQRWLADACQKSVVCAPRSPRPGPSWRILTTSQFTGGRHFFSVTLGEGGSVERLRVERRKESAADYLATLRRLTFDPGPDGPVTRDKAVEAVRYLSARRRLVTDGPCGDVELQRGPEGLRTGAPFTEPPQIAGPVTPPIAPGQPAAPLEPPAIPPQQESSPVTP
jgi:hypothetical protein